MSNSLVVASFKRNCVRSCFLNARVRFGSSRGLPPPPPCPRGRVGTYWSSVCIGVSWSSPLSARDLPPCDRPPAPLTLVAVSSWRRNSNCTTQRAHTDAPTAAQHTQQHQLQPALPTALTPHLQSVMAGQFAIGQRSRWARVRQWCSLTLARCILLECVQSPPPPLRAQPQPPARIRSMRSP
jgi:hypothetical protein